MHSRVCGWYMHYAVQWEERFTKAEQTTLLQFNLVCTQTTLLALPSSKSFIAFLFQTSLQVNINETTLSGAAILSVNMKVKEADRLS